MSNARRFVRIDWWKESIRQTYESVCDTPTKKLAGNIVVGVGVGAAAAYLSYRLYRCIRGVPKPDMITLRNPDATIKLKMVGKTKVTGDTRRLRFALPSPHHTIGVPVGNHLFVSAAINGQNEIRSYTPVSGKLNERGHMDIIVKVYPPAPPDFPNGGVMSQYLDHLTIGDEIAISGPAGLITYEGKGVFAIKADKNSLAIKKIIKRIGMIAGGSGVTAMIPILQKMLAESLEMPKCALLSTNKTEKDIILREELTRMAEKYRHRLKVWYTVDTPITKDWKYGIGRVVQQTIKDWMPKPENGVLILICGPKGMIDAVKAELTNLSYSSDMVFSF